MERLDDGSVCPEIVNLAFMDEANDLFHFRDFSFPALQPDYIDSSGSYQDEIVPFNERQQENIVIFDGVAECIPPSSVDTQKLQPSTPSIDSIKRPVVSFRPRDSIVQVTV